MKLAQQQEKKIACKCSLSISFNFPIHKPKKSLKFNEPKNKIPFPSNIENEKVSDQDEIAKKERDTKVNGKSKTREEVSLNEANILSVKFRRKGQAKIPSNIWEIVASENPPYLKLKEVFKRLIIPHILANLLSILLIIIQKYVNAICYLNPVCDCENSFTIKLYTLLKSFFTYYYALSLLTFYCYFIRAALFRSRCVVLFFSIFVLIVVSVPYLVSDGDSSRSPDFEVYILTFSFSPVFHIMALRKMRWNFKEFLSKSLPGVSILLMMFIQYLANTWGLPFVRRLLFLWSETQGINYYMFVLSIYSSIYLFFFRMILLKFGALVKAEKYANLNPIIFTSRIFLCYIVSINISGLVRMKYHQWGEWVLIIQYCFFLIQFFSRFDFLLLFVKIINKIFNKALTIQKKTDFEIEVEKMLTGSMIDLIFIFIPRLVILFIANRWINFHHVEFYSNCELEMAKERNFSPDFLIFIIMVTTLMSLFTILWMIKLKPHHLIGKNEKGNLLKQTYKIFLVHCFFELVFQDFQKAMYD